jgi:hypothetical protein
LLLQSTSADGQLRDLTRVARWTSDQPTVAEVSADGYVTARGSGSATIVADVERQTTRVEVTVAGFDEPGYVSFRDEIIPVLNRAGCNAGACHGTPTGKGGFKLSLRGYDVPFDYAILTREALGRRVNRVEPDQSLLLQKALGQVPHEGGKRFAAGSLEHRLLRAWIAEGLRADDADAPVLQRLEILSAQRTVQILKGPAADNGQQLVILAHFRDGSVRDVTRLCTYSTSDDTAATVTPFGLVRPRTRGQVAVLCRYQHLIASAHLLFLEDVPGFAWPNPPEHNYIDRHIDAKLRLLQIVPSDLCTDSEFLRRAYLDAIGALPTPDETRAFLADKDPQKRAKLIDQLLRRPEFADFWTLKWADVLRLNEAFMDRDGLRSYHAWIREQVAADRPQSEFVRDLLTATGHSAKVPAVNFYRPMSNAEQSAETVAQLFLGVRMNCARCHNHPYERWTQDDYYGLAAFFAQVQLKDEDKRARNFTLILDAKGQVKHPRTDAVVEPRLPGGQALAVADAADRRRAFADWLIHAHNPYFTKALVNRIWFHVMGRGLVEPVDDFRESNPSVNDALLEALSDDFVRHGYRLKHLVRTIMNSRTYQLSARPNRFNKEDGRYFSRAQVHLLTAEQMLDALCAVTGVPESFAGLPAGTRAVQVPGARVDNAFLKAFNRPARTLACECERERDASLSQALQLISSRSVQYKLASSRGRIAALLEAKKSNEAIVEELYLAALSRFPTPRERQRVLAALVGETNRREALEDLLWALLNSKEFQFRH